MTSPVLTVAISTIDDRLLALTADRLPMTEGVRFLIVVQLHRPHDPSRIEAHLAALAPRPDIAIHRLEDSCGVAVSRNAAMARTRTPLLLFADDDMEFFPAGWRALVRIMAQDDAPDFVRARLTLPEGGWRKAYGPERHRPVTRFNSLGTGTPELAIRLDPVRAAGVRFDEDFGVGTTLPAGDEYIFVTDCLAAGLRGWHVPIAVGSHPPDSSGIALDARALAIRTAVFARVFGRAAMPVRLVFALRHRRRIGSWRTALSFVMKGRPDRTGMTFRR